MDNRISVRLTGPAKIEGKWRKPDEDVAVTPELARELAAAGVISKDPDTDPSDLASGLPGFDEAVTEQARLLADAAVVAAVDAATSELVADRDAARVRAADAEAEVNRQDARIMALEAELAVAEEKHAALLAEVETSKSAGSSTSGSEAAPEEKPVASAPKPARKKGAGTEQG